MAVPRKVLKNKEGKYFDDRGENEKRKKKFERKRKRCKLCREEIDVTAELKIVRLML